jgi:DNA-binding CsgD family transcriptional regulator
VSAQASQVGERVRSAELVAALCLATDLGMGFPFEHGLHTTLIAMRLGERLGVDRSTASQTYYACLLSHAGCTTDAHVSAEVFGGSLTTHFNPVMYGSGREVLTGLMRALPAPESRGPMRAVQVVRRLPRMAREQRPHLTATCEVAQMLAERVGGPPSVQPLLAHLFERWDGRGPLGRGKGDEIPLPMRIVAVAVDASFQRLLGGSEHVVRVVGERAGHAFDPEIAACLVDGAGEILALDRTESAWEETLACEPKPTRGLEGDALDRALAAIGDFADLISPYLSGHSAGERLDGCGYHRGAVGPELAFPARLLAAADAYHAMTEPRPHRERLAPERAAAELAREASAGRLDADAVSAVLDAAGQRAPRLERPAGLTEREVEVVAMLARGLQTKQVARALGISVKTADRHIQNAYRKIGVSTRAAATLFAMEHGLIAWGELPIARPAARS